MANDFQTHVDTGVQQLSEALDAQHAITADAVYAAIDFCKAWPIAKTVLQFIANAVPVVGQLVVSGIIAIGDGVYKQKNCAPN